MLVFMLPRRAIICVFPRLARTDYTMLTSDVRGWRQTHSFLLFVFYLRTDARNDK